MLWSSFTKLSKYCSYPSVLILKIINGIKLWEDHTQVLFYINKGTVSLIHHKLQVSCKRNNSFPPKKRVHHHGNSDIDLPWRPWGPRSGRSPPLAEWPPPGWSGTVVGRSQSPGCSRTTVGSRRRSGRLRTVGGSGTAPSDSSGPVQTKNRTQGHTGQ